MADTLFVACTRPTMKWGVPWDGIRANFILTGAITVFIVQSPLGFSLGIATHLALRELVRVDPHFFGKWRLWLLTKAKSTTGVIWGGSRLQPSPVKITRISDIRSSV